MPAELVCDLEINQELQSEASTTQLLTEVLFWCAYTVNKMGKLIATSTPNFTCLDATTYLLSVTNKK